MFLSATTNNKKPNRKKTTKLHSQQESPESRMFSTFACFIDTCSQLLKIVLSFDMLRFSSSDHCFRERKAITFLSINTRKVFFFGIKKNSSYGQNPFKKLLSHSLTYTHINTPTPPELHTLTFMNIGNRDL